MILPIYNCFNPILRQKATDIKDIDKSTVDFINNMIETMYNADGIGLAANQVGDSRSIIIVDNTNDEESKAKPIVMINPKILSFSQEESDYKEGCLSIPKYYEIVSRPSEIEIEYLDINGKLNKISTGDLFARVIQHEVDHLNGILFFDKITPLKKALSKSKLRKIEFNKVIPHYDMLSADNRLIKGEED
jgi:peptide deformylase